MALFNRKGQSNDGDVLDPLTADEFVTMVLLECCADKLCATILSCSRGTTCSARFSSFGQEGVNLQIIEGPAVRIQDASLVCVTFTRHTQAHVFLAPVIASSHPTEDHQYVTVQFPEQIAGVETRREFRIPIGFGIDIRARVNVSGRWHDVSRVGDLSPSGVKLHFRPTLDPMLQVDSLLIVELSMEELKTTVRGTVRNCGPNSYGIFFPAVGKGKGPASDDFLMIVRRVEQLWLQLRSAESAESEESEESVD